MNAIRLQTNEPIKEWCPLSALTNNPNIGDIRAMATHKIPIQELIGKRFSQWTVLSEVDPYISAKGKKSRAMLCQCSCGTVKAVRLSLLRREGSKNCGCVRSAQLAGKFIDLTGQKFNRLTVIKRVGNRNKELYWLCLCDCGTIKEIVGGALKRGLTQSCGCWQIDFARKRWLENHPGGYSTHGDSKKRIYRTWQAMKSRCNRKTDRGYRWYGAKGVSVCEEWNDYSVFKKWALGNGYSDHLVIDRLRSKKSYSPDNCQFITQSENVKKMLREHGII